ncbi:GPI mannosyltransferase 2 isoform X2 [Neltuma alba]|uniref:GPI mannosyltransferase 2 isoform X2 n=1 Tax=Neltuma alba TaxID=207710 RepID=UPI0010A3E4EA|nr:GPI mannosyltransferase 2 isoform X2 [Prosopis alba]
MANSISTLTARTTIVLKSAILSRLLVFLLIIIFRLLVSPYDTSASLNPDCLTRSNTKPGHESSCSNVLYPSLCSAIEDGIVWDSVYFVRIAQCGYEYEQSYAFLPLLPICISFLSRTVFAPLIPLIGERAVLAVCGYLITNVAFVVAALYFYKLSVSILKDPEVSLVASILFCFNPASIFYSSIYTESLYAFLSFGGLYHLISGGNSLAVVFLALSGLARSNGVLNAGYFCYQTMHLAYDAVFQKRQACSACIFAPFIAFQAYGYHNMCVGRSHDELRPWCKARVPLLYNYIQSHYWGVGFLRYFQLKQLPNFLLASPILFLAFCSIYYYAKSRPQCFFSLGLQISTEQKNFEAEFLSDDISRSNAASTLETSSVESEESLNLRRRRNAVQQDDTVVNIKSEPAAKPGYLSASVLPFVLHLVFMAGTAFLVMHVQVATRFLSASPPLYWFASYMMTSHAKYRIWGRIIWAYSAAYIFLGSLLFSNFYPFT